LFDFFHGKTNKAPSQIKMLAEGIGPYRDLYSTKPVEIITSKGSGKKKGKERKLKCT
jgi:hypothetical protein